MLAGISLKRCHRTAMSKNKQNSPAAKAKSRQANSTLMAVGQQFSGPIPPPDILEKYENILPGAMDRIIAMAENESKHRHEMEKTVVDAEIHAMQSETRDTRRGQYCGLIIGVVALIAGAYAAVNCADRRRPYRHRWSSRTCVCIYRRSVCVKTFKTLPPILLTS